MADMLGLGTKHVGGFKHRWYRDNPAALAAARPSPRGTGTEGGK